MDTLTAAMLAELLHEPEQALLGRVLRMLGQERCAAILVDALTIESNGGMLTRAGDRRRTLGGVVKGIQVVEGKAAAQPQA